MRTFHTLMTVLAAGVLGGVCVTQAQGAPPVVIETVTVGNPGNAGHDSAVPRHLRRRGLRVRHRQVRGDGRSVRRVPQRRGGDRYVRALPREHVDARRGLQDRADRLAGESHVQCRAGSGEPTGELRLLGRRGPLRQLAAQRATDRRAGPDHHRGRLVFPRRDASDDELEDVVREPDATWVIPTENEWYKAAYHANDGVTGNYFLSPLGHSSSVSNDLIDPDPGNNATFSGGTVGDWTIGAPYYRTEVGAHENSESPYGTFDQGGNVQEFNETVPEPDIRGIRGGSWFWGLGSLFADSRPIDMHSSDQFSDLGFRVATLADTSQPVPALSDPGLLVMLLCVAVVGAIVLRPRRRLDG